jgi:D-alanyl-D-alanine carboxypeptidase
MARHADPRRSRRWRLGFALVLVPVVAVSAGFGMIALAGPGLPPTTAAGPTSSVTATGSDAPTGSLDPSFDPSAAPPGPPGPSSSAASSPGPTPAPTQRPGARPDGTRPAFAGTRPIVVRARLQLELDRLRKKLGIPGVSVTIIFRDGTSWTGTSGLANVGRKVAVAPDTGFAIGSVSKTYTAALILALVDEGRIALDTSARTYIPDAKLNARITVRQLLNHTSGLDDYFLHPPIDKALQGKRSAVWPVERTLKYVAKPYFPPGRGWHYSNTNYLYLGLLAERVTGTTLAEALRTRFLEPNGLGETWYQAVDKAPTPVAHAYRFASAKVSARAIDLSDGTGVMPFTSVVTAAGGAGSMAATSADAAHFARLLYTGELLGLERTTEMLAGISATARYDPRVPYGLGVQVVAIGGRATVGHSGRLLGARAAVRHLPIERTTIAVLTNQSRADPGVIVSRLLSIVFGPEAPCIRCIEPT